MYDTASELFNDLLEAYYDEYFYLLYAERNKMESKYKPKKLFLETYNYDGWSENEESTDIKEFLDLSDMPPLDGDEEEVKEGKGLKILTPKKLLTRLQYY